ncbi:hypothetical protein BVIET440_110151 [Burkholderia vietnamiensis]|nr:hypothetical protein BVI2075_620102 [Burkholderia vietnamiensis]CAG9228176.1 hypothetical protein BVI1335_690071 [Burkholderia vietnamiensis]
MTFSSNTIRRPQRNEKFLEASVNRKVDGTVRRHDSYAGSFG